MNDKSESLLAAILGEITSLNKNVVSLNTRLTKIENDVVTVKQEIRDVSSAFPDKDVNAHRLWHERHITSWFRRLVT